MKKITSADLDRLAREAREAQRAKDNDFPARVGHELLAFVIARDQFLWKDLTEAPKQESIVLLFDEFFPKAKNNSIVSKLVAHAKSEKENDQKKHQEKLAALSQVSPIFKYKINNPRVTEAFGANFDFYFCNSVSSHAKRWADDMQAHLDVFMSIVLGLFDESRVLDLIQSHETLATPKVLASLTPQQLFTLYRAEESTFPSKIRRLMFGAFKKGQDGVSLFVSFVKSLPQASAEELFARLIEEQHKAELAFFESCLADMASEEGCVERYGKFWSVLFKSENKKLITIALSNLSKNHADFNAIVNSDYCKPDHLANNLYNKRICSAFCQLKLPLTENHVWSILSVLVQPGLMEILANGGFDVYLSTLCAHLQKAMKALDNERVRCDLVVPLFCKESTRHLFFNNMTRPQFIKLINSCEYEEESRLVSKTLFREIETAENGRHPRFSSVLRCMDEIKNPIFHDEYQEFTATF